MGTVFNGNKAIRRFSKDSVYLTGVTSLGLGYNAFPNSSIEYGRFPYVTTIGYAGGANATTFGSCLNQIGLWFEAIETVGGLNYGATTQYIIVTTDYVPTANSRWLAGKLYVLDNLVNDYKAASNWNTRTVLPISQLPSDYPNCPWLDDLRNKGFIS